LKQSKNCAMRVVSVIFGYFWCWYPKVRRWWILNMMVPWQFGVVATHSGSIGVCPNMSLEHVESCTWDQALQPETWWKMVGTLGTPHWSDVAYSQAMERELQTGLLRSAIHCTRYTKTPAKINQANKNRPEEKFSTFLEHSYCA
jgi:hypothetical protein